MDKAEKTILVVEEPTYAVVTGQYGNVAERLNTLRRENQVDIKGMQLNQSTSDVEDRLIVLIDMNPKTKKPKRYVATDKGGVIEKD